MARRTSQGLWMGAILPSGTAQPDLPPVEAGVRATRPATREVPLTEWRMVLYATRPKTLSPADPCNKVVAVAIEVPHGPVVDALIDRGFVVYAINPKQLDRLRDRFSVAGAKDDRRDA